jgi:SAM-dependent methyltransferase
MGKILILSTPASEESNSREYRAKGGKESGEIARCIGLEPVSGAGPFDAGVWTIGYPPLQPHARNHLADAGQINADQLAFWNGQGGQTWVARQQHTDLTLAGMSDALVAFAAPRTGERVLDVGCGCGATTLDFARAVGPSGRVTALDISAPMLAEGKRRAAAAGITNVDWVQADATTAALDGFDLLASAFGLMFFGDPVEAFTNMRRAANPGARMAFVCWRPLAENPWMQVPMQAVAGHLPPRLLCRIPLACSR